MRQGVTRKRGLQSAVAPPNDLAHAASHDAAHEGDRSVAGTRFLVRQGRWCMQTPLVGLAYMSFLFPVLILVAYRSDQAAAPQSFPRCIRYQPDHDDWQLLPSHRTIHVSERAQKAQEHLENSRDYKRKLADPIETTDCKAQYEWQLQSFPTCNLVHEVGDLTNILYTHKRKSAKQVHLIANGYYRDVWTVRQEALNNTHIVVKTLRYALEYTSRNYDRHQRDAIIMDRLSQSPHILDIYGYCSNAGLFEYANEGSVSRLLLSPAKRNAQNVTSLEKLHVAIQLATAVAELHNVDREGRASIAHTDISPAQFVQTNGVFKLNDFNRARLLLWDNKNDKPCGYYVGNNPGVNRSPEEYRYDKQSEKVDVYSLGNIFYMMLCKKWPWQRIEVKEAMKRIMDGKRPKIPKSIQKSNDPAVKALLRAMRMSQKQDSKERATAREVETFLREKLRELDERLIIKSKMFN